MKKFLLIAAFFSGPTWGETCTFHTWTWDTLKKKSVGHQKVVKPKLELTPTELGSIKGCTVCEEDQIEVSIAKLPSFKICKVFADSIRQALQRALSAGFPIQSLIGYRVGKSKGPVDAAGLRTEFSNHSYGTAIDINSEKNGLYDNCLTFGPQCRLIRGGKYLATVPGSITRESSVYQAFREARFRWGGEINGRQKDFMHFSLDGM